MNDNQKSHKPAQRHEAWSINPEAATLKTDKDMKRVIKAVGMRLVLTVIAARRNVVDMYNWAVRAFKYCGIGAEDRGNFLAKCIKLQLKHNDTKALRGWMELRRSPTELADRIENGLTLKCC